MQPEEFTELFNTILINVTASSATRPRGTTSRDEVVPAICRGERPDGADPGLERRLRVRRGGLHARDRCWPRRWGTTSSGERVKIYATDVDEEALDQARQASLRTSAGRGDAVPELLRNATSSRVGERYVVPQGPAPVGDLRAPRPRAGCPDLAHRPARLPQHADVLQRRDAGARSWRASTSRSTDGGFLFLGKAEMLLTHSTTSSRRSTSSAGSSQAGRGQPAGAIRVAPTSSARRRADSSLTRRRLRDERVRRRPGRPARRRPRRSRSRWPTQPRARPVRPRARGPRPAASRTSSCRTGRSSCAR